jgi:hypothetical protein
LISGPIADVVYMATTQMKGPSEPVKFLANTLDFVPKNSNEALGINMNILLGTPIYVCSARGPCGWLPRIWPA